jgi:enoyl-CoA hydratase
MENILFRKDGHTGIITINRPKQLNALNTQTILELEEVLLGPASDEDVYCLIITGSGEKAFAAGADISEMQDMNTIEARSFGSLGNRVFRSIELFKRPVIAAVNGFALGGGCELSLCCDIRIASQNARFGQPEVTLGITPGFGGTQRLARIAGTAKAREMIFTGSMIGADEALRIGIVNKVVPFESLMEEAMALANTICANAPIAVNMSKAAINRGLQCDMDTAIAYESELFALCFASQDQKDAMQAFVEKRKTGGFNNR